jgi:hypothetical protein
VTWLAVMRGLRLGLAGTAGADTTGAPYHQVSSEIFHSAHNPE